MAALSNYLENELLDHVLKASSYNAPSTIYLALYTSDPTDANTGTEVSGGGYARQAITFTTASNGSSSNDSEKTFTASGGNFGTVTHIGILDSSTGGNLLFHGALDTARTISDGESLMFSVGNITVALD